MVHATYHIGDQSLCCSNTGSIEVDKRSDQKSDI